MENIYKEFGWSLDDMIKIEGYTTAKDIQEELGVSRAQSFKIMKSFDKDLKKVIKIEGIKKPVTVIPTLLFLSYEKGIWDERISNRQYFLEEAMKKYKYFSKKMLIEIIAEKNLKLYQNEKENEFCSALNKIPNKKG